MRNAIIIFRTNIVRVRALGGIHTAISGLTTPALDISDLLRTQIVMAVSALDHYIHEITLKGMLEVFNGVRQQTPAFLRFNIPMGSTLIANASGGGYTWLENLIRDKHSYLSFQHPDKIADAIRLFNSVELWTSLANQMGIPKQTLKTSLKLIIERRNKIVHEADLDPSYPDVRWPIAPNNIEFVVSFIENLCVNINSLVM